MSFEVIEVALPRGVAANPVWCAGAGPPLVFLHGAFGQEEGREYHRELARSHRVYAPLTPGAEDPADLERLENIHELLLYYDDLFDALSLQRFDLVGHCFGGMIAAELAATMRERVRRLVLIDPLGLWRDETPVADYVVLSTEEQLALLFNDHEGARAMFIPPLAGSDDLDATVRRISTIAATSHFVWPIPERGLYKRLPRIHAPTLIIWGHQDAVTDVTYAQQFAALIPHTTIQIIEHAGHYPHWEHPDTVAAATTHFLTP